MAPQTFSMPGHLHLLIIVISIICIAFTAALSKFACDPHFNGRCTCGIGNYEGYQRYIVNCTDAGFTSTAVLVHMPAETQVLIFTGNRIDELPPNVFGSINDYPRLSVIDMSNNHIREIRGKAYHHVASVELLILNHNNLTIASNDDEDDDDDGGDGGSDDFNYHHPRVFSNFFNLQSLHLTNAFADNTSAALSRDLHDIFVNSNLTKLVKLHLEQNEIVRFADRNVFCDLPALRELYLADNLLSEVNFNVTCMRKLHFLNLERNRFELVRTKDLQLLDRLQELQRRPDSTAEELLVDWNLNPFVCDCQLRPFVEWLSRTVVSVRNREQMTCQHRHDHVFAAGNAARQRIDERSRREPLLDYEAPQCQLMTSRPAATGHVIALAILLGAFSALLLVLIVSVGYMSRERIRRWFTPMLTAVSKKVQYTTIRNEDQCPEVHV